jgi:ABC-type transport system involved in multi-copper enzyme maturation permease subunit
MFTSRIGLGPVFAYEWITSSRRWQAYALRSLFVASLFAALLSVWANTRPATNVSGLRYLAELGEGFFLAVVGTQLTVVLLAAPAATAGAICLDRARGTLLHMLMTDLSAAEIVLGKLAARLTPVLAMLACTLPVLELVALMGGVDPTSLLGAFVVTLGVAVLGCSLAMALSLWVGKTHEALLCTYAIWLLWLLAGPMVGLLSSSLGWSWFTIPRRSEPFFLALAPYWWPGSVGWSDYIVSLGATCSISAVLVTLAVIRLRSVCTHQSALTPRRSRSSWTGANVWRRINRTIPWLTPSLDGNPVVWREWHRSRPSRWTLLITLVYGGLSMLFSTVVILWPGGVGAAVVNGLQVSIGLLLFSVTTATSLAEERARGSLELLMSTPLSTRQIVFGKWLGAFRAVPLLAILPAVVVWAVIYSSDTRRWWYCPEMIIYVLCAGAALNSLGLAMATRFSRVGRAVGATVVIYVLVAIGWVFLATMVFGPRSNSLVKVSPLVYALRATLEASQQSNWARPDLEGLFWIVFFALAATALMLGTLGSFNVRMGRVDDAATIACQPIRSARVASLVYCIAAISFTSPLFIPRADLTFVRIEAPIIYSLGLLLVLARASWPTGPYATAHAGGRLRTAQVSTPDLVRAKWVAACRQVPAILLMPLLVVFLTSAPSTGNTVVFLMSVVDMLSVSFAAVSLGVALWAWCRRGAWAVILAISAWALTNTVGLALASSGGLDPSVSLRSFHPFSGVTALAFSLNMTSAVLFSQCSSVAVASAAYLAAAGLLFVAALRSPRSAADLKRNRPEAF